MPKQVQMSHEDPSRVWGLRLFASNAVQSRQSREVLIALRDLTGNGEWVFPGDRGDERTMSNNAILKGP
jgi:hypothetical protein